MTFSFPIVVDAERKIHNFEQTSLKWCCVKVMPFLCSVWAQYLCFAVVLAILPQRKSECSETWYWSWYYHQINTKLTFIDSHQNELSSDKLAMNWREKSYYNPERSLLGISDSV